jgi:predicted PurR-regulated permease PerM
VSDERDGPAWPEDDTADRPPPRNGMPLAAMLLGVVSLAGVFLFRSVFISVIAGLLGLVFGILAFRQVKRGIADKRGFAIAGIVLGALGLVVSVVLLVLSYHLYSDCKTKLGHSPSQSELTQCVKNKT